MALVLNSFRELSDLIHEMCTPIRSPEFSVDDWETATRQIELLHVEYFATSVSPDGEAWAPLAPLTVKRKGHSRILFETNRLYESLTSGTGDSVRRAESTYLEFGTRREWAWIHQVGSERIPARPHTGISNEGMPPVLGAIADTILAKMVYVIDAY